MAGIRCPVAEAWRDDEIAREGDEEADREKERRRGGGRGGG